MTDTDEIQRFRQVLEGQPGATRDGDAILLLVHGRQRVRIDFDASARSLTIQAILKGSRRELTADKLRLLLGHNVPTSETAGAMLAELANGTIALVNILPFAAYLPASIARIACAQGTAALNLASDIA